MKRLFLARHAETGEQLRNRYVGAMDVPISAAGVLQVSQLADRLSAFAFGELVCSPLMRCRQTADILSRRIGCQLHVVDGLAEVNFGRWEGLSFDEICGRDPDLVEQWGENGLNFTFPGGENVRHFHQRVQGQIDSFLDSDAEQLLVVSHGGVIRSMICALLGLDLEHYLLFNVQPARFVQLDISDRRAVLSGLNL